IGFREEYLVICDYDNELDGFNKEAGYLAMKKLLELGPERPSAVFIASDIQAIGAIHAIQEKGLQIPEDIAMVSFDDIELAEYFGLTTMRQPIYAMGKLAVQRLMDKISGKGQELFQKTFQPELIIRQSCGATGRKL
ncbi:MAG: substrate-binding domain-containing protein, partial [candidate division KSB1 bacterium]|nr:substrate-binding domain-containing protein [candidate division KSB1 bacterium]